MRANPAGVGGGSLRILQLQLNHGPIIGRLRAFRSYVTERERWKRGISQPNSRLATAPRSRSARSRWLADAGWVVLAPFRRHYDRVGRNQRFPVAQRCAEPNWPISRERQNRYVYQPCRRPAFRQWASVHRNHHAEARSG